MYASVYNVNLQPFLLANSLHIMYYLALIFKLQRDTCSLSDFVESLTIIGRYETNRTGYLLGKYSPYKNRCVNTQL